jgi:Carboxypeptidase regulatory-like domain
MRHVKAALLPVAILSGLLCACAIGAFGQNEMRTVRGTVIDKAENPLPSAIVHLKNVKTNDVRTYISDSTGQFRFSGLDPNVDYELHAETDTMTSNTRTISSFDPRTEVVVPLKVDREKKKS